MAKIIFKATGVAPGLLMHNPQHMRASSGTPSRKTIPTAEVEAEAGAYRLPSENGSLGQLYAPDDWFRESFIGGAKGLRVGKEYAISLVRSTVFAQGQPCPLFNPETEDPLHEYAIDARRAVVQGNGVLRHRPLVFPWAALIELEFDPDYVNVQNLTSFANIAGRRVGVGDYRPSQGGPFGRYTVEVKEVQE